MLFAWMPEFHLSWLVLARFGAAMIQVDIGFTPRELRYNEKIGSLPWRSIAPELTN
jgi:hypothetical protein